MGSFKGVDRVRSGHHRVPWGFTGFMFKGSIKGMKNLQGYYPKP